ncbi:MAG: HAD-IIIA family hydrolase [Chloroflexi bacterium]|nr:HAD-IIIA family hydrolase [Chloroflexota bacterium]MCL5273474.1 HAD-IIIA family hydrolase [Chloroflexota bacterium]
MARAILFDLDETLFDRSASIDAFLKRQYVRYKLTRQSNKAFQDRFKELDEHGYADKQRVYQILIDEFAIPASIDELLIDFRSYAWVDSQLYPDSLLVLNQLRGVGYKLGIITNGSYQSQTAKLNYSGLMSQVDIALISEEEEIKKPEVVIFRRAADRLGVKAEECVFVGDNPLADIEGACNAGMRTVWCKRSLQWPEGLATVPDYTITALAELLAITF